MRNIPLTMIIPTYNRNAELDRALRSVMAQDVRLHEVIVVDDSSTVAATISDDIKEALPIRVIRHEANGGEAAARNTGLAAAATDWVTFLDDDDRCVPGTIGARWRFVEEDQEDGGGHQVIYGCGWVDHLEDGTLLRTRIPRASADPLDFASGCWFCPGSCVILNRTAALGAVGGFDEGVKRFPDYDWFLRLAMRGFQLKVQPLIGAFIERKRRQDPARVMPTARAIMDKWMRLSPDRKVRRRVQSHMCLEIAAAYHFSGHRFPAAYWLARSWLATPRTTVHLTPGWKIGVPDPRGYGLP